MSNFATVQKLLLAFVAGAGISGSLVYMSVHSSSTTNADILVSPTDEEASIALNSRPESITMSGKPSKFIVKLGKCYKGSLTEIQCGADIDFSGNGTFQQRQIGFSKTPTGWMAMLF